MLHFEDLNILVTTTSIMREFQTICFHFINILYNTTFGKTGRAMFSSDFNKRSLEFWRIQVEFLNEHGKYWRRIKKGTVTWIYID